MDKLQVQCEDCKQWVEVKEDKPPIYIVNDKTKVICDKCLPF